MDPTSDPGNSPQLPHKRGSGGGDDAANLPADGTLSSLDSRLPSIPTLNWSYGPPPRPEILSAKPNPIELLHALRRRWTLAVGLGVSAAVVVAGLLWFLLPIRYEAFALLKVSGERPAVLEKGAIGGEEFDVFKRTQMELILSFAVLNGTLRDPAVNRLSMVQENADDQVSWLKGQLIIDYPNDAEIMRIAMRGRSKGEVTKIVDKVVEVYLKEIVYRDKQLRMEHEQQLQRAYESQSADYQKQLAALDNLQKIHKTSGSQQAQIKKDLATRDLEALVRERNRYQALLGQNAMDTMLANTYEKDPYDATPAQALIEAHLDADPIVRQMTEQMVSLTEYINELRARALNPEKLPRVRQLQRRRLEIEERLDERKAQLRPKILGMLAAEKRDKREGLLPLRKEDLVEQEKHIKAVLKQLQDQVNEQTKIVQGLQSFSEQVATKAEEVEALRLIKNKLKAELDTAAVERLAQDRIIPIDRAQIENGRGDAVRKYVAVAFSFIFTFSAVVLGVAVLEFQSRKVNSVKEVNDGLGIRVIGELPSITGRAFRRVRGGKGQAVLKALMSERIDGTRTALIHTTAVDPPRVVMVTSAEAREGKTTTCSQLAASLARSGRRTLLVDADIRNPGVHRVFEMPQDPGLCELLRGEAERDAVIHPTRTANLWLLPAGRCDLRSVQALSSSFLGTTLATLGTQFDYVIIDSGPVLKVADSLLVGQHVDAAIVASRKDTSRVPNVYEAVERLRSVGITVLGSVVNGVKDDTARHGVELLMAATPSEAQAESTTAS